VSGVTEVLKAPAQNPCGGSHGGARIDRARAANYAFQSPIRGSVAACRTATPRLVIHRWAAAAPITRSPSGNRTPSHIVPVRDPFPLRPW